MQLTRDTETAAAVVDLLKTQDNDSGMSCPQLRAASMHLSSKTSSHKLCVEYNVPPHPRILVPFSHVTFTLSCTP